MTTILAYIIAIILMIALVRAIIDGIGIIIENIANAIGPIISGFVKIGVCILIIMGICYLLYSAIRFFSRVWNQHKEKKSKPNEPQYEEERYCNKEENNEPISFNNFELHSTNKNSDNTDYNIPKTSVGIEAFEEFVHSAKQFFPELKNYNADLLTDNEIVAMGGLNFEHYCASLLKCNGYQKIRVTPERGDKGVDITAEKDGTKYAIQCKNYADRKVDGKAVQEVFTGRTVYHCDKAVVLTNSTFTSGAKNLANQTNVLLWNKETLHELQKNRFNNIIKRYNKAGTFIFGSKYGMQHHVPYLACLSESDAKGILSDCQTVAQSGMANICCECIWYFYDTNVHRCYLCLIPIEFQDEPVLDDVCRWSKTFKIGLIIGKK